MSVLKKRILKWGIMKEVWVIEKTNNTKMKRMYKLIRNQGKKNYHKQRERKTW